MKNFAWVNTETEYVENIIYYDGVTPIEIPSNVLLVEMPEKGIAGAWSMAGIGWKYVRGQFIEPPEPEPVLNPTPTPTEPTIGGAPNVIA
jgi:hypothetical protein